MGDDRLRNPFTNPKITFHFILPKSSEFFIIVFGAHESIVTGLFGKKKKKKNTLESRQYFKKAIFIFMGSHGPRENELYRSIHNNIPPFQSDFGGL